jgi:phospholipase C
MPQLDRRLALAALTGLAVAGPLASQGCTPRAARPAPGPAAVHTLRDVAHFVVIAMENRSFDNLWGEFPGADGILGLDGGSPGVAQIGADGGVYALVPSPPGLSPFPEAGLPNAPFAIEDFVPVYEKARDLHHQFFTEQFQIASGKMNAFAYWSDARGLVMGHYHTMNLPLPRAARDRGWTVCDRFFHAAFGGSFLNHQLLVAARPPEWPEKGKPLPPASLFVERSKVMPEEVEAVFWKDPKSGRIWAVNTAFSENSPRPPSRPQEPRTMPEALLPPQKHETIGGELTRAGVDWAWYAGGWNNAVALAAQGATKASTADLFQYHHQPFVYFEGFGPNGAQRSHLRDEDDFRSAATCGKLPAVSFVKPVGIDNEHPGYADVLEGENYLLDLVDTVMKGPNGKDTVIIVTYDENGGFWDHVPPPAPRDPWGPGVRVPAFVVTPWASGPARIDSTTYDTTSILATLERRFGLAPLADRDRDAAPMTAALGVSP